MRTSVFAVVAGVVMVGSGCVHRPDVVLRPGTQFTKASTLGLTVAGGGGDAAIFKPELEKELMRRGFNIVSDDVSQIVSEERTIGGGDVAAVTSVDASPKKSTASVQAGEVTQKQTSKIPKSDYSGRIDYLYSQDDHVVRRVNFTIFEVRTGSVVASIGYEKKGKNPEIANAIANYLDAAVTGIPVKEGLW